MSLANRFWAKVEKRGPDECWPWIASLTKGYGQLFHQGRVIAAHRVSLMLHGVELPPGTSGLCVDHVCRNPVCVNPAHLRIVPSRTNATENSIAPSAINAAKTHCKRGHPFTPENTARIFGWGNTRHGKPRKTPTRMRVCLTCYPYQWHHAVIERPGPPRARKKWTGPMWEDTK